MSASTVFFFTGCGLAVAVIVSEWIRYFAAAGRVQRAAKADGGSFSLFNHKTLVRFTYLPDELITHSDSPDVRRAKEDLLQLRRRMWKIVALAVMFQVFGVLSAIVAGLWEEGWLS